MKILRIFLVVLFPFTAYAQNHQWKDTSRRHLPEIPVYTNKDIIVNHKAYTLCFNAVHKQANWVAYELTAAELIKKAKRNNLFVPDPQLAESCGDESDYLKSGYDRGHLAPAGDMAWDSAVMHESFYYSNMSPQAPALNRGAWNRLEQQVRTWTEQHGHLYIVSGPVLHSNLPGIGPHHVSVPEFYFKAVLFVSDTATKAIGFIMPNTVIKEELQHFAVSIDSVEKITGFDLFHNLDDKAENATEKNCKIGQWNWEEKKKETGKDAPAQQCKGITKKGKRCGTMTKNENGFCDDHAEQSSDD